MAKILCTGAAGFVGSHLADALIAQGHNVHIVDDLSGGFRRNLNKKAKFKQIDLRRIGDIDYLIKKEKFDIIHHLACHPYEGLSQFCPNDVATTTFNASLNVFRAAARHGCSKIIFYSSMARFGHSDYNPPFYEDKHPRAPVDVYGAAKCAAEVCLEALCDIAKIPYTILVPHNVAGPRQNMADPYRNVLAIWINRIRKDLPPLVYGEGTQRRAFSHIDDIIPCCVKASEPGIADGEIINIGSARYVTILEAARLTLALMEKTGRTRLSPQFVPERPREVKEAYCSIEKSQRLLGFQDKKTLADIINDMISYSYLLGEAKEPRYLPSVEIEKGCPEVWLKKLI